MGAGFCFKALQVIPMCAGVWEKPELRYQFLWISPDLCQPSYLSPTFSSVRQMAQTALNPGNKLWKEVVSDVV